jgi:uncharacterized membrane protein
MKLRFIAMGCILIFLSLVLLVRRNSADDFILTGAGVVLLGIGVAWKKTGTKAVSASRANQICCRK